jgi:membrane associated rhomboid family serine protease
MINITPVVKQLIIINIIFYVGSNFFGNAGTVYDLLSLHEFHNPDFKIWQLLTHMFMHAPSPEITHILLNMFGLFMFGTPLEHFWGGKKFLIFYIVCGLGAGLVHSLINYVEVNQTLHILEQNGFKAADVLSSFANAQKNLAWEAVVPSEQIQSLYDNYQGTAVGASGAIYGIMVAFAFMLYLQL